MDAKCWLAQFRRIVEDSYRGFEPNTVLFEIRPVLIFVPLELHAPSPPCAIQM